MKYKLLGLLSFSLILCSCATSIVSNYDATPVPKDRVLDSTFLMPKNLANTLVVKRDSGVGGSACNSRVFLNGQPIADLATSEKITFYLLDGEYIVSAWPKGICAGRMAEVRVIMSGGKGQTLRIGYGSNGDYYLVPTAF